MLCKLCTTASHPPPPLKQPTNSCVLDNTKVYPELLEVAKLAPNPYFIFFPLMALHYLPPSIQHSIACFALCHRIHQLPRETERLAITEKWSRVFFHRGVVIRNMAENISRDSTRCSNATICAVCLFLCLEVCVMP